MVRVGTLAYMMGGFVTLGTSTTGLVGCPPTESYLAKGPPVGYQSSFFCAPYVTAVVY